MLRHGQIVSHGILDYEWLTGMGRRSSGSQPGTHRDCDLRAPRDCAVLAYTWRYALKHLMWMKGLPQVDSQEMRPERCCTNDCGRDHNAVEPSLGQLDSPSETGGLPGSRHFDYYVHESKICDSAKRRCTVSSRIETRLHRLVATYGIKS